MSERKYIVKFGNYYPREVDSWWDTKEEAQKRADELNEAIEAAGLGCGMWEIE